MAATDAVENSPGNSSGQNDISPIAGVLIPRKDPGRVKITVFGLTLSSSWGNGHATPYRAIIRALDCLGHQVHFFEKDVPYYSSRRDFDSCDYCKLTLYSEWTEVRDRALSAAADSDVVITASFLPEGRRINDEILDLGRPLRVFYDLDTPVTLSSLRQAEIEYLDASQIPEFDLVLSFTGGQALAALENEYRARMVRTLYGCVDPEIPMRPELHGNIFGRPPGQARRTFAGTFAPPSGETVSARGIVVSLELGMAGKRTPHGTRSSRRPLMLLFLFTPYAEHHAR